MRNQSIRLYLYSSAAIFALTLLWGMRSIPKQADLGERAVRSSLEQEMVLLSSAVRASTQALKYRLLDVLKAEGNERATRAFQQSPFVASTLLEWNSSEWKVLWHSSKNKNEFGPEDLKTWTREWPLASIAPDQTYFVKVGDQQGTAYFAVLVPVRKPNNVPMFGVGIFPAAQFGLSFSGERSREVRVFDNKGFALALSHPAYLGASLKRETVVEESLLGDEVNTRAAFKNEAGKEMIAFATRMSDSNLFASVETLKSPAGNWKLQSWVYLLICALGAAVLNYVLFSNLHQPLMNQLRQAEDAAELYKKQLSELPRSNAIRPANTLALSDSEIPNIDFIGDDHNEGGPIPVIHPPASPAVTTLGKVVQMSLRSLDAKVREFEIKIQSTGLEQIELEMDVLQLQTAVEEILKNAIEAMQFSELKLLSLDAGIKDDKIWMTIEDTGSGISSGNLAKVFDPFFSTKDSEGVARGLGLNVVRRVIEELKGKVDLESHQSEADSGTTVTLEWPVTARPLAMKPVLEIEAEPQDDARFLIDEDDEIQFTVVSAEEMKRPETMIRKPKVRTLS